jgi:C1A family cysteine protease
MMKGALILATLVAVVAATRPETYYHSEFTTFVQRFSKSYQQSELFTKYNIFKANLIDIEAHNAGDHTWTKGVNEFSDMTDEEFMTVMAGGRELEVPEVPSHMVDEEEANIEDSSPLDTFDWREKGKVQAIKNQGSCGSCWAFGGAAAMESVLAIQTNALVSLSEQQLLDCTGSYGNHGCGGGVCYTTMQYAKDKGVCLGSAYPYKAKQGTCNTTCTPRMKTNGYVNVGAEGQFKQHVQISPFGLYVDCANWKSYSGGVFTNCGSSSSGNHYVALIGWQDNAWLIKNSWGTSWGEKGFMRVVQGKSCGIIPRANCRPTYGSG